MPVSDWDKDEQGDVMLCPCLGFETADLDGDACGIRIEFARSPEELAKPQAIQLCMWPAQAAGFAQALLRAAAILEAKAKQRPKSN